MAQKIERLTRNGAFKSRSTFVITINRNTALDSMLLDRPKKIVARRHTESVMKNNEMPMKSALKKNVGEQNDSRGSKSDSLGKEKVPPKNILKVFPDKPLTITGRRRSVGYLAPNAVEAHSLSAPSRNTTNQADVVSSNDIEKIIHESSIEQANSATASKLTPVPAPGSAVIHPPMVDDLVNLSEYLPMSNATNFDGDIGRTNEEKWSLGDCFGFSSNTSATTINMNCSLSTSDNIMESDVNHDQACMIPEPVHMDTNHTKSMNAVRKYVNNIRKEERILGEGLRTYPIIPLNIPALIPIQRVSHILPKSYINDPATIEMSMNANSDFGHMGFDDEIRDVYSHVEPESEFDFHLHFSDSSDSE